MVPGCGVTSGDPSWFRRSDTAASRPSSGDVPCIAVELRVDVRTSRLAYSTSREWRSDAATPFAAESFGSPTLLSSQTAALHVINCTTTSHDLCCHCVVEAKKAAAARLGKASAAAPARSDKGLRRGFDRSVRLHLSRRHLDSKPRRLSGASDRPDDA